MQLFLTCLLPQLRLLLVRDSNGLITCSPYYKTGLTPGTGYYPAMLQTRRPGRSDCYLQKTTQAVGSRICQSVLALDSVSLPPRIRIHGRCSVKVCILKGYGGKKVLPHPSHLESLSPSRPTCRPTIHHYRHCSGQTTSSSFSRSLFPPRRSRCPSHLPPFSSLGTGRGEGPAGLPLGDRRTVALWWVGLVEPPPPPQLPALSQHWFHLIPDKRNKHPGAGESGGQHLPLPRPQQPRADLTPGRGLGGGGCSQQPRGRRQEVLCVCLAPETPVLPPACSLPPGRLCAALFILQPWQPGPACSPVGLRQPLPAPAQSWQPRRLLAKHNHPAVDTVVDFGEGKAGKSGRGWEGKSSKGI